MIQAKQELLAALAEALAELAPGTSVPAAFESPKQAAHGDLACTAAMQLAKPLKKNPREFAQALIAALQQRPAVQQWVDAMEIAGPGFINLRLKASAKQAIVPQVLREAEAFGRKPANGQKLMVEFVSANPTGPLHVGHARQGALGDSICHLFETQGWKVQREFYYNDAGVQIATLAMSTQARIKGLKPGDAEWPENAYNGDYIADVAADYLAKKTIKADDREFTASGDPDDLDNIRQFAVAYLRHEQDLDLQAFGVQFDHYFLESSLYTDGKVDATVKKLIDAGKTYEHEGALWLKTTDDGDDKDRVMRKSDGTYTYFVPDVAYHVSKWERGFTKVINCQGTDHYGTIARVRAGLQGVGVGIPKGYPDYVLNTMVRVVRDGAEVKISKRAGSYVTLRDLIEWTSRDAVRFFLISRKADTEFTFDVDLALKQNDENPVFYVQYAHARICSVLRQYVEELLGWPKIPRASQARFREALSAFLVDSNHTISRKILSRIVVPLLANTQLPGRRQLSFLEKARLYRKACFGEHIDAEAVREAVANLPLELKHVEKLVAKLIRDADQQTPFFLQLRALVEETRSVSDEFLDKVVEKIVLPSLKDEALTSLQAPTEIALMQKLAEYPEMLERAAADLAPHDVAFYLRDVSASFHSYYAAERFLLDDNAGLTRARLALLAATRQVLRNGLTLLGVSHPDKM